jgi:hypothetical protein
MMFRVHVFASVVVLTTMTAHSEPKPLNIENLETMSATVTAIDVPKRMVSLRGTEGRTATFEVSPDVRNLPQVKIGDNLVVRYYQSMAAEIRAKDTSPTLNTVDKTASAAAAAPGAKPGAVVGATVTTTVTVESVDKQNNTIMFSGADNLVRRVPVKRPEAQKFISTLKQGDQVEITYTEALAVSIEKAK